MERRRCRSAWIEDTVTIDAATPCDVLMTVTRATTDGARIEVGSAAAAQREVNGRNIALIITATGTGHHENIARSVVDHSHRSHLSTTACLAMQAGTIKIHHPRRQVVVMRGIQGHLPVHRTSRSHRRPDRCKNLQLDLHRLRPRRLC